MSQIGRIVVPIYEPRETDPAHDHARWLADRFRSRLLVAGIARRDHFTQVRLAAYPGAMDAAVNEEGYRDCKERLAEAASGLARAAKKDGIRSESTVVEGPFPGSVVALTRQSDLLVESELHRNVFYERLFDSVDLYSDTCCPILMTRGEPFSISRAILLYNGSGAANRGLRWLMRLAREHDLEDLGVLWTCQSPKEGDLLSQEVQAYAQSHGVNVWTRAATKGEAFHRTVALARELQPGLVAIPMYAFPRPLRLRFHGIDAKALKEIQASVLLFA